VKNHLPSRSLMAIQKDKRQDLKTIITGITTDRDGLVVYSKNLDGNTADCDYNHQMVKTLPRRLSENDNLHFSTDHFEA